MFIFRSFSIYTLVYVFINSPDYTFHVHTVFHLVNFSVTPFKCLHHLVGGLYNMLQKETQGIFFSFLLTAQKFHIYGPFCAISYFSYKVQISIHN